MSQRHTVIPRTLCFVFNEERTQVLLLEFSNKKGAMAGRCNALGGHIEAGEDIVASAKREIMEESGLAVEQTRLAGIVHISGFFDKQVIMFVTESVTLQPENIIDSDEGTLHWVSLDDVHQYNIFEDIPLLLEAINVHSDSCFTATSCYGDGGKLLEFVVH